MNSISRLALAKICQYLDPLDVAHLEASGKRIDWKVQAAFMGLSIPEKCLDDNVGFWGINPWKYICLSRILVNKQGFCLGYIRRFGCSNYGTHFNNKLTGYGERYYSDTYYKGYFAKDKKEGYGEYYHNNGIYYKCHFVKDKKEGYGEYYHNNGIYYKGHFVKDKKEGYGEYYWPSGTYYKGHFMKGKKEGYGEYYYRNGNYYKGHFVNDKKEGYGEYYYRNGTYYKGHFVKSKKHGYGEYYWPEGVDHIDFAPKEDDRRLLKPRIYKGEFKNGEAVGDGIFMYI